MQIQIFICKKTWCKKVVIFYVESCYKNSIYFHIYYICVVSEIKRNVLIIWFIFLPSISWVKRFYLLNTIHFVCFFKLHCLWLAFILPLIAVLYKCCLGVFIYNACINSTTYLNVVCTIVCYLFSFCDGCFTLPKSNFKDVYSMVTPVTLCVIMSQCKNYDFRRASRQSIDRQSIYKSQWLDTIVLI